MKRFVAGVIVFALALGTRTVAAQQPPPRPTYERDIPAALLAQAKVSEDSARALALAKLPGSIEAVELLKEHGKLVWVWDVKVAGKRGITEVSVDALNGAVETHEE